MDPVSSVVELEPDFLVGSGAGEKKNSLDESQRKWIIIYGEADEKIILNKEERVRNPGSVFWLTGKNWKNRESIFWPGRTYTVE